MEYWHKKKGRTKEVLELQDIEVLNELIIIAERDTKTTKFTPEPDNKKYNFARDYAFSYFCNLMHFQIK